MVSLRCKLMVKEELAKLGLHAVVDLGVIDLLEEITPKKKEQLRENLLKSGLELLDDKKSILIERIKNVITEMIIQQFIIINKIERVKELLLYDELNLTEISYKLHYSSVSHLSNQFKHITGLTPSHFKKLREKRKLNLENL